MSLPSPSRISTEDQKSGTHESSFEAKENFKANSTAAVDVISVNSKDADEALGLVGVKRTDFSEEYNIQLRKKLVCGSFH